MQPLAMRPRTPCVFLDRMEGAGETEPAVEAGQPAKGPELFFVLVTPVGTPDGPIKDRLREGLSTYGYSSRDIKLSNILRKLASQHGLTVRSSPEHVRVNDLMDVGDQVCEDANDPAVVAVNAIEEISALRATEHPISGGPASEPAPLIPRRAWIIDSVKRVAEVKFLRALYGDHVIVVALQASVESRRQNLHDLIKPNAVALSDADVSKAVEELIDRDLNEAGHGLHGQNILKTFPLADVFINTGPDAPPDQVGRMLDLLFLNPNYHAPTPEEYGMHVAHGASSRSPELGLKVGAAIMNDTSHISVGANVHPTTVGTPSYDQSTVELRRLILDTLLALNAAGALSDDAAQQLDSTPDEYVKTMLAGPLEDSSISGLTEFQIPVHAEMDALMDAVSRGATVKDAHVYVTAYPCHGCAKHLVRLGLDVVYLEPYPKSRAEAMYGEAVKSSIRPFTGIAPRRYEQFFSTDSDRKNSDGVRRPWTALERVEAQPHVNPLLSQGMVARESLALKPIIGSGVAGDG